MVGPKGGPSHRGPPPKYATERDEPYQIQGHRYLDMSYSVAKVAEMNVPITSLKIISEGKQKNGQKLSCLLAKLSFH